MVFKIERIRRIRLESKLNVNEELCGIVVKVVKLNGLLFHPGMEGIRPS